MGCRQSAHAKTLLHATRSQNTVTVQYDIASFDKAIFQTVHKEHESRVTEMCVLKMCTQDKVRVKMCIDLIQG